MADQVTVDNGTLTDYSVSTDDAGASGQVQRVKLAQSADGSAAHITADADGLLVNLGANNDVTVTGAVTVQDGGGVISIDDNAASLTIDDGGGSLTVDNGALAVVGGGAEATALRVTIASDSTGVLSIDDNGASITIDDGAGSITIDGSVSITGAVDTELPAAAALADNAANPTAPAVGSFLMVWDGSTWDRAPGTAADGQLVNLGANNDVVISDGGNVISIDDGGGSITIDGSATISGQVDTELPAAAGLADNTATPTAPAVGAFGMVWDGATWDRMPGAAGGLTVAPHAVTNAGTFMTQLDGAALTALQLLDEIVRVDDAAFTPGTHDVAMSGYFADETSTDSVDEGDGGAARMTLDRRQIVVNQPHAAGGCLVFRSIDLDETEEEAKGTAGTLYGYYIANLATTTRFVKFYNATAASVVVGTTTPVMTLPIPGNATDDVGANMLGGVGIAFDTAITVAATTGIADADTGAPGNNDVVVNLYYR